MITNVVLDMGNVLLDYNPEISLNLYCSSQEEKDVIRRELFEGPEWALGDRGDIRDADRFELVKVRVPAAYHEALRNCTDHWDICMNPLPGAREFCELVKERGYGIYVLSNASDAFYRYFPKFLPLDFFNGVFVSSDYRMLKPDAEIYEAFLARYGLLAEECLFIDDRAENVAGAEKAGMQAFRFRGDFGEVVGRIEMDYNAANAPEKGTGPDFLQMELADTEWPAAEITHDRNIARGIVYDGEGYFYFVHVERDDAFGHATVIETPGGGVEEGEDLATAIHRELSEELGADVDVIGKIALISDYYNVIGRHNLSNYFLCKVRSFGEKHLTKDEIEDFHLQTMRLTYEEALAEYEKNREYPFGRLVANREVPVLQWAKQWIEKD